MIHRAASTVFNHYDNTNSLTRDELANERAFLAYVRCSTTLLISSFSILQVVLKAVILLGKNTLAGGGGGHEEAPYGRLLQSYTRHVKPVCLFLCALSVFTSCLGLKKSWLNLYNLAERARIQPGVIGMLAIFVSIFVINILLLRQCIVFGMESTLFAS